MRTETNRRRYSDADIERLQLLKEATKLGRSIGQIANLSLDQLHNLMTEDATAAVPVSSTSMATTPFQSEAMSPHPQLEDCLAAVERFDAFELESILMRARVALSQPVFIDQLIVPLMSSIGKLWRDGDLRIMHEHLASAVVRPMLWTLNHNPDFTEGPGIIVTTPVGQWHELGALIVASTAAADGWNVTYLGTNLPAEEIAAAAQHQLAKAVALSLVYPADDPRVIRELSSLRRYLGHDIDLMVGGQGSTGYQGVLDEIGAVYLGDIAHLRQHLESLRNGFTSRGHLS